MSVRAGPLHPQQGQAEHEQTVSWNSGTASGSTVRECTQRASGFGIAVALLGPVCAAASLHPNGCPCCRDCPLDGCLHV